jgi:hypothetical protein
MKIAPHPEEHAEGVRLDLPSPAEAGFAKAGGRIMPVQIASGAMKGA